MPKYYVATYGRFGLEVEFYDLPRDYDEAVLNAEEAWECDQLDSYTYGEVAQPASASSGPAGVPHANHS